MSRYLGLSRVVALFWVLGCSHDGVLVQSTGPGRPGLVVQGSVAHVSGKLQDGLCDAGIAVLAKKDGRNERLVGKTESGKLFCLHLRPETSASKENTVVSIEWGRDPDEQFWRTLTGLLASIQETSASPPEDTSMAR
jgi:hypothetical protein